MYDEAVEQRLSENLARCSRCGLCLAACPTFQLSGLEIESPRGRIQLMTAVRNDELQEIDALAPLDACLRCHGCESPCPTGVDLVGALDDYLSVRRSRFQQFIGPWRARALHIWRKACRSSRRISRWFLTLNH